ncbi:hypothetical protein ACIQVL_19200 [Streptomyces sp. NPDC090499]|uniref:hypothetical protein n=1 Tax=Streptomyces sp. NPDC090499 TaxID=3365965 RepID=UPI00381F2B31
MSPHETCIHALREHSADGKANMVDSLVRRGLSRAEALSLVDRLSTSPADHRAARAELSHVLEFRAA